GQRNALVVTFGRGPRRHDAVGFRHPMGGVVFSLKPRAHDDTLRSGRRHTGIGSAPRKPICSHAPGTYPGGTNARPRWTSLLTTSRHVSGSPLAATCATAARARSRACWSCTAAGKDLTIPIDDSGSRQFSPIFVQPL